MVVVLAKVRQSCHQHLERSSLLSHLDYLSTYVWLGPTENRKAKKLSLDRAGAAELSVRSLGTATNYYAMVSLKACELLIIRLNAGGSTKTRRQSLKKKW